MKDCIITDYTENGIIGKKEINVFSANIMIEGKEYTLKIILYDDNSIYVNLIHTITKVEYENTFNECDIDVLTNNAGMSMTAKIFFEVFSMSAKNDKNTILLGQISNDGMNLSVILQISIGNIITQKIFRIVLNQIEKCDRILISEMMIDFRNMIKKSNSDEISRDVSKLKIEVENLIHIISENASINGFKNLSVVLEEFKDRLENCFGIVEKCKDEIYENKNAINAVNNSIVLLENLHNDMNHVKIEIMQIKKYFGMIC